MKYIRTKDGVWLFGGTHHKGNVIIGKKQEIDFGYCFDKKDIIKHADTIEELCDGFIFKDTNANELHFLDLESGISILGASLFKETLRGFIETGKGLIYVAKMNEKGELELL